MYKSVWWYYVLLLLSLCTKLVLMLEQQTILNTTTVLAETATDTGTNNTLYTPRNARLMQHVLKDLKRHPQHQRVNIKARPHKRLLTRSDNFHYQHASMHPMQLHALQKNHYPLVRRVHSPHALKMPNNFYEPHKNSRFFPIIKNNSKNNNDNNIKDNKPSSSSNNYNAYRATPYVAENHPNALSTLQNFKASPLFNGQAVVRPVYELLAEAQKHSSFIQTPQQQQQQHDTYAPMPVKQYPLPYVTSGSSYLNQYEQYAQQQQQQPTTYYQSPSLAGSSYNNNNFNEGKQIPQIKQYAVHEEPLEITNNNNKKNIDGTVTTVKFANSLDAQEALEFLQFMGSDAYFLPKIEPNYKKIDEQIDDNKEYHNQQQKQQQHQQQYYHEQQQEQQEQYLLQQQYEKQRLLLQQQQQQQQDHQQQQEHQQQQQQQYEQNLLQHEIINSNPSYENKKNLLEAPRISQLLFPDHMINNNNNNNIKNKLPRNSNIIQASYQTANNLFVVNSDGNKSIKHIVSSTPQTLSGVTDKSQQRSPSNSIRRLTPEPVRFEFTEQDAMVLAPFTSSPITAAKRNKLGVSTPQYIRATTQRSVYFKNKAAVHDNNNNNNNNYNNDDDNDNNADVRLNYDDMQEAANSDMFGRVPVKKTSTNLSISSTVSTPSEVKDTEEYCERICANVQDDDEEVICGSDGYMYTSEAQLECYASCLNLDVTITGKGSCSLR